jgi:uncharacterized membrane protein HdeD (DUF308 family)
MLKNLKGFKWFNAFAALTITVGTTILAEPVLANAIPSEVVGVIGVVVGLLTKFYPHSGEK